MLHLHPALAPYKCAVLPLSKKEDGQVLPESRNAQLAKHFMVDYDDTGSIGKRYRRQDEIGTPVCITLDFETVGDPEQGHCGGSLRHDPRPRQHGTGTSAHL